MPIVRRPHNFVMIEKDVLDANLSMIEKFVYIVIQIMEQSNENLTIMSIAAKADLTIDQVSSAIENMVRLGWIEGGVSV